MHDINVSYNNCVQDQSEEIWLMEQPRKKSFCDKAPNFLWKLCEVSGIINDLRDTVCQNHCLIEGMSEIHQLAMQTQNTIFIALTCVAFSPARTGLIIKVENKNCYSDQQYVLTRVNISCSYLIKIESFFQQMQSKNLQKFFQIANQCQNKKIGATQKNQLIMLYISVQLLIP